MTASMTTPTTTRILFVCLGNICRSPSAEAVFRDVASQYTDLILDSAGTSAFHVDEPPYGPMQTAARARGYDLSTLRSRQFTAADFDRFDLIVAMDRDNLHDIETLRPSGATTRVTLFTDYAAETGADHIPDPYYTRDFDGTLDLIEASAHGLLRSLTQA